MMLMLVPNWCLEDGWLSVLSNALLGHEIRPPGALRAVCHVSDWPPESGAQHKGLLCESVYLKQRWADRTHFLPKLTLLSMVIQYPRTITHLNFFFFVSSLSSIQMRDRLPLNSLCILEYWWICCKL